MKAKYGIIVVLLVLSFWRACPAQSKQNFVTVERAVPVTMRDGVVLYADIYRPDMPGKFPVLLQRTPYDKNKESVFAVRAASHGYIVIVQDVRGRYSSHGEWYPFKYESQDGYDTVEWAAKLPYANSKVGMYGDSYVGATQMLAAISHPPHLAGICPMFTPDNYHRDWVYQDGAFELWFDGSWTSILARDTIDRYLTKTTNPIPVVRTLPLTAYPLYDISGPIQPGDWTPRFAPYFLDWLAHPEFDSYWLPWSIQDHYADIRVPDLTVGAWYDIFLGGALRNYAGIRAHGGSTLARQNQHLLIAIGGHAGDGRKIGDVDFGAAAAQFHEDDVTLAWYDYLFKGVKNSFAVGPSVRIFLMGRNQWRNLSQWPPTQATLTHYYLHSNGKANSLSGDGTLSTVPPGKEALDAYTYNPENPVPTIGGPLCCDSHIPSGPQDQRPAERRNDVLVYSTPAFARDMTAIGPVTVELYGSSSARDTDFTAKLVDVDPDGYARNLTEGILRAEYRNSQTIPTPLVPGRIYKLKIDLWATGNTFLAGHRLRVEISSSNFPRFARNLNTGKPAGQGTTWVIAKNRIYHDAAHPSALNLCVVPN